MLKDSTLLISGVSRDRFAFVRRWLSRIDSARSAFSGWRLCRLEVRGDACLSVGRGCRRCGNGRDGSRAWRRSACFDSSTVASLPGTWLHSPTIRACSAGCRSGWPSAGEATRRYAFAEPAAGWGESRSADGPARVVLWMASNARARLPRDLLPLFRLDSIPKAQFVLTPTLPRHRLRPLTRPARLKTCGSCSSPIFRHRGGWKRFGRSSMSVSSWATRLIAESSRSRRLGDAMLLRGPRQPRPRAAQRVLVQGANGFRYLTGVTRPLTIERLMRIAQIPGWLPLAAFDDPWQAILSGPRDATRSTDAFRRCRLDALVHRRRLRALDIRTPGTSASRQDDGDQRAASACHAMATRAAYAIITDKGPC